MNVKPYFHGEDRLVNALNMTQERYQHVAETAKTFLRLQNKVRTPSELIQLLEEELATLEPREIALLIFFNMRVERIALEDISIYEEMCALLEQS